MKIDKDNKLMKQHLKLNKMSRHASQKSSQPDAHSDELQLVVLTQQNKRFTQTFYAILTLLKYRNIETHYHTILRMSITTLIILLINLLLILLPTSCKTTDRNGQT